MGWNSITGLASFVYNSSSRIKVGMLIILILIIVLIILIFLLLYLRKTKPRAEEKEIHKRVHLNFANPRDNLIVLSKNFKEYLKEHLDLKEEITYEEIIPLLERKGEIRLAHLCKDISQSLYSGQGITKEKVADLALQVTRASAGKERIDIPATRTEHKIVQHKPVKQKKVVHRKPRKKKI